MGPQKLTEKHFKIKNIDDVWMAKAIETFAEQKRVGKMPLLWDRHNTREAAAQVIGRLDNMRVEDFNGEPWLFADVVIVDEAHKQKFLEGKSPSKSVEFQPDSYYMRGLALLDGHEGHFDYGIPDFVPEGLYEELKALGLSTDATVMCYSKINNAMGAPMDFSLEDVKAAIVEVVTPIQQEISAIKQHVGMGGGEAPPAKEAPAEQPTPPAVPAPEEKKMSKDIDSALDSIREEERNRYNAELANIKRQAKIDLYTMTLSAKTGTPEKLVRKQLESFKSEEAMDLYVKNSQDKKNEDVKLGIEREQGDKPDLRDEYEVYVKRFKAANGVEPTSDFETYVQLAENLNKPKDRRGKAVHAVRDAGGAFA
jgi:hypothetical protein